MTSRRSVLKSAAAVGAAFHIVPRHVLGRGFTAPSDTVRLAAIGIGGKGESDITEMVKAGASVAALCDVDWRSGAKSFARYPDAKQFKDYREMLATMGSEIDAVSVLSTQFFTSWMTWACSSSDACSQFPASARSIPVQSTRSMNA